MDPQLIYDVGMHNGDDTAYYLFRGYRVVAVEASPILVARARARFADAIAQGRLTLLNAGIADSPGSATFWINARHSEWSSFDRDVASRDGSHSDAVVVPCTTFDRILAAHGVPFYLKIDIEGSDIHCLRALSPGDLPQFVSIEAHALDYLCILRGLGYRSFKIVNQRENWKIRSIPGWRFRPGSSGPFGDEAPGAWDDFEVVVYDWLHARLGYPRRSSLTDGWHDFHASLAARHGARGRARPPLRFRPLRKVQQKLEAIIRRAMYGV